MKIRIDSHGFAHKTGIKKGSVLWAKMALRFYGFYGFYGGFMAVLWRFYGQEILVSQSVLWFYTPFIGYKTIKPRVDEVKNGKEKTRINSRTAS